MVKKILNILLNKILIKHILYYCLIAFIELALAYRVPFLYKGLDFPKKNALQYQIGTLEIKSLGKGGYHLLLRDKTSGEFKEYSCMYSANEISSIGNCMNKGSLSKYVGKDAVAGWYMQSPFLGSHTTYRQLVSLKVGNDLIMSYESTAAYITDSQKTFMYIFIPIGCVYIFTFYLLFIGTKAAYLKEIHIKR